MSLVCSQYEPGCRSEADQDRSIRRRPAARPGGALLRHHGSGGLWSLWNWTNWTAAAPPLQSGVVPVLG